MKKAMISTMAFVTALASVPLAASAAENDVLYGTMNIPYADFYRAELSDSSNAYEVDAVSSATTNKWSKNGEGELFDGTYNEANPDGTGTILGVTYSVAITQADLDALGDSNYSFTAIDYVPSAYKTVTVTDGTVSFSTVQDETPETATDASIKLSTSTPWGDYLLDVENGPELGAIYGALVKTTDGNTYAMCHEANIWRGELAWSSGIKTSEPHGNTLPYENFVSLMGATINEIVFITANGYTTIATDTYVPVKFAGEITIDAGSAGDGKTAYTTTGFPTDYQKQYSVADNFLVTDSEISYTDALAGSYTLTISDAARKYADMTASFVLSSDTMPAVYADGAVVKADDADDSEFENFLKNISKVSVNGTEYSASGKGSVKIIGEDGTIDTAASSRDGSIFAGDGKYEMIVTATGYTQSLIFTLEIGRSEPEQPTTQPTTTAAGNNGTTTVKSTTTTAKSTTTTASDGDKSASPKTSDAGVTVPAALTAVAAIAAAVAVKKKNR